MGKLSDEEIIDCANAAEWENWLASHHEQPGGVWLPIAKKGSSKKSVTISAALDVALCYGWIDSQRKGGDESYYLQRYSARRATSPWSKLNVERVELLIAAGRMQPAGFREVKAAKQDGRWEAAYASQRTFSMPAEFEAALAQNEQAKHFFDRLDKSEQYAMILPILKGTTAERRAASVQKAIAKLISKNHRER